MYRPHHLRPTIIAAAATAVALMVIVGGAAGLLEPQEARWATSGATSEPSSTATGDTATSSRAPGTTDVPTTPAGPTLKRLAAQLTDGPADTTSGAFSYVAVRVWSRLGSMPADGSLPPVRILRIQRWTSGQGIARWVETDVTTGCEPGATSHADGKAVDVLDVPPPQRLEALRRLLYSGRAAGDRQRPVDLLWGYAALAERQAVTRPVRVLALQLVAEVPGTTLREDVRDRAGRPGLEVAALETDGQGMTIRYTLVLDPVTGVLLAAYTGVASPPISPDPKPPAAALHQYQAQVDTDYRLYETAIHTTDTSTPAASCTGP